MKCSGLEIDASELMDGNVYAAFAEPRGSYYLLMAFAEAGILDKEQLMEFLKNGVVKNGHNEELDKYIEEVRKRVFK